ncbi:hypothetical protein C8039_16620 [Halogeometricum sp. wsp3]|nr:hypothetical protein C8039_16620 [Halogeometricum sp. wsp3]
MSHAEGRPSRKDGHAEADVHDCVRRIETKLGLNTPRTASPPSRAKINRRKFRRPTNSTRRTDEGTAEKQLFDRQRVREIIQAIRALIGQSSKGRTASRRMRRSVTTFQWT